MLLKKLIADVEARAGVTKAFQLILGASLLTNVFMAGAFATMDRTVRTILTPPEINKTFWVDGRAIGPEYLEQMGHWVVSQFATVSPASVDYQSGNILKYVHPSVHGELAIRFKMASNRLKAENMSKIFLPREVRISEKGQMVAFIGSLQTWIADKRASDEMKAYLVAFDYDGSKVTIKELRETNLARPFDPPAQVANAEPDAVQVQQQAPASAVPANSAPQQAVPVAAQAVAPTGLPPAPPPASPAAQEALQSGSVPSNTTASR